MPYDNPFSFHCMICFEEFHPEERYPVVLPCGHTYVCNVCANRLDKCPECRMLLYTVVRPNNKASGNPPAGAGAGGHSSGSSAAHAAAGPVRSSWSSARSGAANRVAHHQQQHGQGGGTGATAPSSPKNQPPVKKRLPLPKNVVLLSLIEATELATQDVQKKYSGGQSMSPLTASDTNAAVEANAMANKLMMPTSPHDDDDDDDDFHGKRTPNLEARTQMVAAPPPPPPVYTMNSMVDVEDEEEEKIKVGTSMAIGVAGTYAVAAREGMEIFPSRPASGASAPQSGKSAPASLVRDGGSGDGGPHSKSNPAAMSESVEDVDSLIQVTMNHNDSGINDKDVVVVDEDESQASGNTRNGRNGRGFLGGGKGAERKGKGGGSNDGSNRRESPRRMGSLGEGGKAMLAFGDRVQVVAMDGPWAKLARGYGYVRADRNKLVKVGGPIDQACKLEAMLRSLSHKRKELRMEQSRVDSKFIRLMNDLQMSLQQDEDLTVIVANTFGDSAAPRRTHDGPEHDSGANVRKEDPRSNAASPPAAAAARRSPPAEERNDTVDIQKPARLNQDMAKPTDAVQRRPQPSFVCFAGDVFSSYSADQSDIPNSTCVSTNSLSNQVADNTSSPSASSNIMLNLFPAASHPSPSALRAGAQAWRERQGQMARNGIDFRTGMSGHMGLVSSHSHPHEYLTSNPSTMGGGGGGGGNTGMLRMSSHTGLTMSKSRFRGILSSLTLPSFGASGANERRGSDMVQPSESM